MERAAGGDGSEQATAHQAFHLSLVALAGHQHLMRVYEPLLLQLQLYMATNMRREAEQRPATEGARRHRRLFEAVAGGDLTVVLDELAHHGSRAYLAPELGRRSRRAAVASCTIGVRTLAGPTSSQGLNAGLPRHPIVDNRRCAPASRSSCRASPRSRWQPHLRIAALLRCGTDQQTRVGHPDPHAVVEAWRASPTGRDAAWISVFTPVELHARADELAARRPAGLPLYGVPFAVKDNIDVAGLPTTAACPAFAHTPQRDASGVARLVAAGAIAVGKTNMDQFATGLNGTRSPYGAPESVFGGDLISGGSSSGSAVAVAAGWCPSRWAPTPRARAGCPPR